MDPLFEALSTYPTAAVTILAGDLMVVVAALWSLHIQRAERWAHATRNDKRNRMMGALDANRGRTTIIPPDDYTP